MAETLLDKKTVIAQLVRSPHGALKDYAPVALDTARKDPEFYGHLVAWNYQKGSIRDAKVALPVLALCVETRLDPVDHLALQENALAHLADLRPKQFLQAAMFAREVKAPTRMVKRLITRYLRDLEADHRAWERTALQHREALRTLYGYFKLVPGGEGRGVSWSKLKTSGLELHPYGEDKTLMARKAERGKFAAVRTLAGLPAVDIANTMAKYQIPFLIARGALGARAKEADVLMALVKRMTPTELVTNAKALKRLGVLDAPELRATFEEALAKAGKRTRKPTGAVLKTTKAAEVLEQDTDITSGKLAASMRSLQEKQLDHLKTIEGDWLILADCSASMASAMEVGRQVAGILARTVQGKVYLTFFNNVPRTFDVTGKSYEQITTLTRMMVSGGGTNIGCGLDQLTERKLSVDGICIVSDGGHNGGAVPRFSTAYEKYRKTFGNDPVIYFYALKGDPDYLTPELQAAQIAFERFNLTMAAKIDHYSLPNLVQTMRINRYSLVDEIMDTPLRTLDEVLKATKGMEVLNGRCAVGA